MNKLIGFEKEFSSLLNNLNNNTLNNSLLLTGNKGIGKYFFLLHLIKKYLTDKTHNNQTNHHISLLNNNTHPNIKILTKEIDEKTKKIKNVITINQVRDLNKFLTETSIFENISKIILIDSADDLNINASNSLLKMLEEPKNDTFFF